MTRHYTSLTPHETQDIAAEFTASLKSGDVIRLEGDLGAGKTVFAAGVARGLGIKEQITSPTYPIVAEYRGSLALFHLDLYRIKDSAEARDTGLEDYIGNEGITLIEWPSRAEDILPDHCITVEIRSRVAMDETSRTITISYPDISARNIRRETRNRRHWT
ncbi:MAG: tRNA (adenosine(37)-N6)-threonylcarbamoyltransferase complex ATPase subunit type 1 TsaE [Spirochaeta sp.]|nr:tRNA (adenosine(37)-N6)-threonylcarbamoyltransferase complex ATPase subunit type 1 TsaE [Spirochaeta sp.]